MTTARRPHFWGASDTGFTVSGVFRDLADFAVLVLFQKDDPFGHPLFSYLPDGDLTGLVLDFDVTWQGIQSWESLKNAWTDWNSLDYSVSGVGSNSPKWFGTTGKSEARIPAPTSRQGGDRSREMWGFHQSFRSVPAQLTHTFVTASLAAMTVIATKAAKPTANSRSKRWVIARRTSRSRAPRATTGPNKATQV